MDQSDREYVILDSREAAGALDSWDEHLCLRRTPLGHELAIYGYELLGEVPDHWYDEDTGEPLPPYRDEFGDIALPAEYERQAVTGVTSDRYLVGSLVPVQDNAVVTLAGTGRSALVVALDALDWPRSALAALMVAVAVAPVSAAAGRPRQG
jgi:hypothetical protein